MNTQAKRFLIILIATLCWIVVMRMYSPANIVQFEFAGTTKTAGEIISAWGTEGVALASTSIYLDFIFLILYCASFSLGCIMASRYSANQFLIKIAKPLSIIVWVAGVCDAIENIAMLQTLENVSKTTVSIAWYFAAVKFSILAVGFLFIISASITGLVSRVK